MSQVFYIKLKVFSMKNFGGREHPLTLGQASHLISDRKPLSGPGLLVAVHEVVMVPPRHTRHCLQRFDRPLYEFIDTKVGRRLAERSLAPWILLMSCVLDAPMKEISHLH